MKTTHQHTRKEKIRNVLLVILALGMVVVFFNLDISREGESVFSKTTSQKLRFSGDLKRNAYTGEEVSEILDFIKIYDKDISQVDISVTKQDSYRRVTGSSQLIFEINMIMEGGTTINTPTWRSTRDDLVKTILVKMKKDVKAYTKLKGQGRKMKSLVNTK